MNILNHTDCLLLIDCQYGFVDYSKTRLIYNLNRLTKHFRDRDKPILILEYTGCGLTLSSITDILQYYQNKNVIQKNFESGTPKILREYPEISKLDLTFHVAGVNWSQCVFKTARDLLRKTNNLNLVLHKYASNPGFRKCDNIWEDLTQRYSNRIQIINRSKDYVNK